MASKAANSGAQASQRNTPHIIKKYPNRRLYDTATSSYITLADVRRMVLEQMPFSVRDAKTNEDLTRSILLQIILDEEAAGVPMFSNEMLAQMIRFYSAAMQGVVGGMFEQNVRAFLDFQRRIAEQGAAAGAGADAARLGADLWQQFMQMQGPALQGMMSNYLEQSTRMFLEMQQKMQENTRSMFSGFGFPDTRGTPGTES